MNDILGYQAPSTAFLTGGRAKLEVGGGKQSLAVFSPYEALPEALWICVEARPVFSWASAVTLQDPHQLLLHGRLGQQADAISRFEFVATQTRDYVHKGTRLHWSNASPFMLDSDQLGQHQFGVIPPQLTLSRHDGAHLCGGYWGEGSVLEAQQMMVYIKDIQGQVCMDIVFDPRPEAPCVAKSVAMGELKARLRWHEFLFSYRSHLAHSADLDHHLWIEFIPG